MENNWNQIEPKAIVELNLPYDLNGADNFPEYSKKFPFGPIRYKIFRNSIISEHGALISSFRLIPENFYNQEMMDRYGYLRYKLSRLFRNKTIKKKGHKYLIIFDEWSAANLYHFYFHSLEKIVFAQKVDALNNFKILIPPRTSRFVDETLNLLGINEHYRIQQNCNLNADFAIISPGNNAALPSKKSAIAVRNLLLPKITSNLDLGERIYISRQKAEKRKVLNHTELEQLLSKYQFKTLYAEDFSLEEQISIFKNAKFVVSPHGAGLSNIIFMNKGSKIIEISTDIKEQCVPHFMVLANHLELDYYYLDSKIEKENYSVDLENLEKLIYKILKY